MVNVLESVKGGTLKYGTTMECDRIFKEWVDNSALRVPASQGEGSKWGKFLMIGSAHQQLAKDIVILKNNEGNFEEFVKLLNDTPEKSSSHTEWLQKSGRLTEFGKILNQAENQKLLGLALSTTFGKPLRYCVQHEIAPAASYWSYYADLFSTAQKRKTVVVIVGSSSPVLAVSRAVSPLMSGDVNVILVPDNDLAAIPCLLMGELMNKAGLDCSVYAGSHERLKEITALGEVDVIVCGSYNQALALRDGASNLKLDLDGKKAVLIMEMGDCDAAVDAALIAMKTSNFTSPGLYLIVQDSMRDEIEWRLRERFSASRSGTLLDKMVDFPQDPRFEAPGKLIEQLEATRLDVLKVGGARVIFDAQPSLPLTQLEQLGQTLLVFSYRSVTELLTLVGNLSGLSEVSLWSENQSVALHVINQIQVPRVWVNGFASYEPGFDHLLPIKVGKVKITSADDKKANAGLYPVLDGLRSAQRSWANQGNRNVMVIKFLKQLLSQDSTKIDLLMKLISAVSRETGKIGVSTAKRGMVFDLANPVGLIAIIVSDDNNLDAMIRCFTMALLAGNAVMLSTSAALSTTFAQNLAKIAKETGLPNVIAISAMTHENNLALLKHHGVRMLVVDNSLPAPPGDHLQRISLLSSSTSSDLAIRRWVWTSTGEGLAN